MPFYLRKAKKVGPLRVNLSKTGLGASVGVKGARVAVGPRGTIVNMGRGGVYYRKSLGRPAGGRTAPSVRVGNEPSEPNEYSVQTADVDELIESSSDEMVRELNAPRGNWFTRMMGLAPPAKLHYELDQHASKTFESLQQAIQTLAGARATWLVEGMTTNVTTEKQKRNAGAARSVKRRSVRLGRLIPPKISTNVEVFGIDIGNQRLLFFPDRLLIYQQGKYASVDYPDLAVEWEGTRFVEDGPIPEDAEVLGYTWQYVNKTGGPDRRFSNNRQLPILAYGAMTLTSATGLRLALQTSNNMAVERCASLLMSAIGQVSAPSMRDEATSSDRPDQGSEAAAAILSERPFGWEYLYFSQRLSDEIASSRSQPQTLEVAITSQSIIVATDDFPTWILEQISSLSRMAEHAARVLNDELPIAFGAPGSPGDPEKIRYVAVQLGDAYREALSWPRTCASIRTDSRWSGVLREAALFTTTVIDEIRALASRLETELPDKLRRGQAGENVTLEITLSFGAPDMEPFNREMKAAERAFGLV